MNKTLKYLIHSDNDIDPDIGRWIDERIRVNRAIKHDGTHFTKYLDSLFPEKEEVGFRHGSNPPSPRVPHTATLRSRARRRATRRAASSSRSPPTWITSARCNCWCPRLRRRDPSSKQLPRTYALQENMYLKSIDVDTGAEKDGTCTRW